MSQDIIYIKGARVNNLKNITIKIPKNKLVVMTGVSGSGKTSLAFDTIYAEGQRRYVESLSAYSRQFLDNVKKPDVDLIEGLSPAISIDQKTTSNNPRSTVGTVTEIYDFLRLLFARIGKPICPNHNIEISSQTYEQMTDIIMEHEQDAKIIILAPVAENRKGTFESTFNELRKSGYSKVEVDGEICDLDDNISLEKNNKHTIRVVVDRLKNRKENQSRLYEAIETACNLSGGKLHCLINDEQLVFSEHFTCPECGFTVTNLEPTLFSFNAPIGACTTCKGLGFTSQLSLDLLITDENKSIADGAIRYLKNIVFTENMEWQQYKCLFDYYHIDLFKPYKDFTDFEKEIILYGSKEDIDYTITSSGGLTMRKKRHIEGLVELIERRYLETTSSFAKEYYGSYLKDIECPTCHGHRLNEMALSVKVGGLNIDEFTRMTISDALTFIDNLQLNSLDQKIANLILKEIRSRLQFLQDVGLGYLTLNRKAGTLSGGEAQRIRLATQIGSNLSGVIYVLDEPSIGLHQRDNHKLIDSLKKMRDLGNTLVVVEHDEEIMNECDYIIDIGPFAGVHGGNVTGFGTPDEFKKLDTITAKYLSHRLEIKIPDERRTEDKGSITIKGAREHNLKNIDVKFPLNKFICVTGVSGSGKSTLVDNILYSSLMKNIYNSKIDVGLHDSVENIDNIEKVINIDQSPIGRTPRSNPATYTGVFDMIRTLFSQTVDAKARGYSPSRFSFNVKGGRCEKCTGDGVLRISMHFLPDVYVPCDACDGSRYNRETLEVKYKGKTISDVLDMTVEESLDFFNNIEPIRNRLQTLYDVGLGYIKLGQSSTTLSGGEAQRVKLASELYKKITPKTIFILDEPSTGLHTYDISKLINILNRIVDEGGTVIVIEHNLDIIKVADYIIDLGPEGGDLGGNLIAVGTPEEVAANPNSYTGEYLKKVLRKE